MVVIGLFVASFLLAFVIAGNYARSERILQASYADFERAGAELTAIGCVDELLDWSDECGAMSGLCDFATSGMMLSCLNAGERTDYCTTINYNDFGTTGFGYHECQARDLDREKRKVCATAYRAIAGYCLINHPRPEEDQE